ncbi:MAG TPA: hypothetical protein VHC86_03150 [Opitutaceae bacterium]|nr:hypothetical protein [Opitutaceae bacterium]
MRIRRSLCAPLAALAGVLILSACANLPGSGSGPAAPPPSPQEARAAVGRGLAARYADAVVEIEVVTTIKITVGNRTLPPQEVRRQINGTVLNAAGLTLTSLSEIDPRGAVQARTNGVAQRVQVNDVEFKEAKLRLADGTEIPARVVLKDPDQDLAFIAPLPDAAAGKRTFVHADLDHPAAAEVLGDYYLVARAAKVLQRAPVVREITIEGIAEKPRRLFLVNQVLLGCPLFDPQGRLLGVALAHIANGRPNGAIVMPAAELAQGAALAAAAAAKPAEGAGEADDSAAPSPPPPAGGAGEQAPP